MNGMKLAYSLIVIIAISTYVSMGNLIISDNKKEIRSFDVVNEYRRSVTFIMGEDKPGKDYYQLANEFFINDKHEKTESIISTCQTIQCMIEYLNFSKGYKYDVINMVVHGNSKTGLNLYLSRDGHKATPKRMLQEAILNSLPKIEEGLIDSNTNINIWSCGIGTNPLINLSMKKILAPMKGDSAKVYCSPYYVVFKSDSEGYVRKIDADYWPYYFKRGYRPSPSEIIDKMEKQYPNELDWEQALYDSREIKGYTMDYHIPISFTKTYKKSSDRPDVSDTIEKQNWIKNQKEISDQLEEIEMNYNDFHWQVNKVILQDENGNTNYAIKAIGMSTVLCFLRDKKRIDE